MKVVGYTPRSANLPQPPWVGVTIEMCHKGMINSQVMKLDIMDPSHTLPRPLCQTKKKKAVTFVPGLSIKKKNKKEAIANRSKRKASKLSTGKKPKQRKCHAIVSQFLIYQYFYQSKYQRMSIYP